MRHPGGSEMASFRSLTNRALKHIMPKGISRRGMRRIYESETLVIRQRQGKHGGWMYADYKDVTSGRWIRNVRIRTGDYRAFMEYRMEHPRPKGLADSSSENFRTVMLKRDNPVVKALTATNRAVGILKARQANGLKDEVLGDEWYTELEDAVSKGDSKRIRDMVDEWFRAHSDEEIEDFFDYEADDLLAFEAYL